VIAAVLLIAIVATILKQNHDDEVLGFHRPGDLQAAQFAAQIGQLSGPLISESPPPLARPADAIRSAPARPTTVSSVPLDELLAGSTVVAQTSPDAFYPGNLGLGTLLTYRGVTSEVVGVISFDFKGKLWQDYLASHEEGQWWRLGVEPDQGMKLEAFEPRHIAIEPGPNTIEFEGSTYSVTDSGPARYRAIGETNQFEEGKYWYFDYEDSAGVILSFERFDTGPWVTSIGHHVDPHSVLVGNARAAF